MEAGDSNIKELVNVMFDKEQLQKKSPSHIVPTQWKGVKELYGISYKGNNSIHEDSTLLPNHLPNSPTSKIVTLSLQHMHFVDLLEFIQ